MTATRPRLGRVLAVVLLALSACGSGSEPAERANPGALSVDGGDAPVTVRETTGPAAELARDFLDRYVEGGRVVRRDEGGDTVSEGQAYGLLAAVGLGDRSAFDEIWDWTRRHMQRDDGTLAWRWDGEVVDPMPATDADVDAAHALLLAAARFGDDGYREAALEIADGVLAHSVVEGRLGPVAVAGPWATPDRWVNPSYGAPVAYAAIAEASTDRTWDELDDSSRRIAVGSARGTDLPPDWARVTENGIEPRGTPSGGDPVHGYEAGRVAVRFATDCDPEGPPIAASLFDEYQAATPQDGHVPALLGLDGSPQADHGSPVMSIGHAAAALAAGDADAAGRLLEDAATQSRDHPTYYGDAWVVLGWLWLTTDHLGGCAAEG